MASNRDYSNTDSVGSCNVHGFKGEELTVRDNSLYALDIVDAPNLTTLNIEKLQTNQVPHLLIENAPRLQRIKLPTEQPGAIIHLSTNHAPGEFTIEGAVCEIDAAWPGVQFRQEACSHRKNWNRVIICSPEQATKTSMTEGLVIVTGKVPAQLEHLALGNHCDWLLTDIDRITHVQIMTTGSVTVDQLPALRTVFSTNHQLQLSITRTPSLRRISGCGELVLIRQSDWQEKQLTIDGRWNHAKIASDQLEQLSFKEGRSLIVYHCSRLKMADLALGMDIECHGALPAPLAESARFFFEEAPLNNNIEALRAGDMSVLPVTLRILGGAHEPAQVVHCLQQLVALCVLEIAPEQIWECRRELSARHHNARYRPKTRALRPLNQAAMVKADFNWHWHLPEDLAPQGWEADLDIWTYCKNVVPAAADFSGVMVHTCQDPVALETLIRKAGIADQDEALRVLAVQAIEHYVRKNTDYMPLRHRQGGNDLIRRLTRLFKDPYMTEAQKRPLVLFLCNTLEIEQLLGSVPRLLQLAPGLVRVELMKLSQMPERWFIPRIPMLRLYRTKSTVDYYRSKLRQAALASAGSESESLKPEPHKPGTYLLKKEEAYG